MWIVSRLPENLWPIAGVFLNIISDIATGLLVYFSLLHTLPEISVKGVGGLTAAEWGLALVLSSPALLAADARLKGGVKGRALGLPIVTAYFLGLWEVLNTGDILIAFFLTLSVPLLILISVFGTQSLIFFTVFVAAMLMDPRPLVILGVGFVAGYLIPGLGCREVINWKISHYLWYFTINYKKFYSGKWKNINTNSLGSLREKKVVTLVYWFVYKSDLFQLFIVLVPFLPAIIHTWLGGVLVVTEHYNLEGFALSLVVSGLITAIITNLEPLRFLGKGSRYLEYFLPFLVIWFVVSFHGESGFKDSVAYIMAFNLTACIFNYIKTLPKETLIAAFTVPRILGENESRTFKNLNGRILCLPLKAARWVSGELEGDAEVFQRLVFSSVRDYKREVEDWDLLGSPLSPKGVERFCEKHRIHFVVMLKEHFTAEDLTVIERLGVVLFDNSVWRVYEIK